MVNDFILKSMDFNAANVDLRDFMYSMLVGMYERTVKEEDINLD